MSGSTRYSRESLPIGLPNVCGLLVHLAGRQWSRCYVQAQVPIATFSRYIYTCTEDYAEPGSSSILIGPSFKFQSQFAVELWFCRGVHTLFRTCTCVVAKKFPSGSRRYFRQCPRRILGFPRRIFKITFLYFDKMLTWLYRVLEYYLNNINLKSKANFCSLW